MRLTIPGAIALCLTLSFAAGCSDENTAGDADAAGSDTVSDTASDAVETDADGSGDVAEPDAIDTDEDPDEDPAVIDVSEALCTCDDDCLPLGDGSLCNGTVCTFGVDGIPCDDPPDVGDVDTDADTTDVDDEDASDADDIGDAADDTDTDAADAEDASDADPDAADAGDVDEAKQTLIFVLDSSGGFAGMGTDDILWNDDGLTIRSPFAGDCTVGRAGYEESVLALAERVPWADLERSYFPPENPSCCCDQFNYELTLTLIAAAGGEVGSWTVSWCDQSRADGVLPAELEAFVSGVGDAVSALRSGCPDE